MTLRSKVLRGGLFANQNDDHIVVEHHSELLDVDPLAPTYLGPLACNSRTVYSKLYDSKSINSVAPGNAVRNNSDAGRKNADVLSETREKRRQAKGARETMRVAINVRWGLELEKQVRSLEVEPITKEAVKEMILAEKAAEQQGAGEKAKRKREAVSQEPATKKPKVKKEPAAAVSKEPVRSKEQKQGASQKPISSFFQPKPKVQDQAATGTFAWDQLPSPSPPVKAKSPSAVIGAGFIPAFSLSL